MSPIFSLAHLTVLNLVPPNVIDVAALTGYQQAGIRLLPASPGGVAYPLMNDVRAMQDTMERIQDTGVSVFDLEIIRLDAGFQVRDYLPFFEIGQRLGAKALLNAGDDPDETRLTASFASLCEAAAPFGLTADLEFYAVDQGSGCQDRVAHRQQRRASKRRRIS
jgi:hypothetical protein